MQNEYSNILNTQPTEIFDQLYESVIITTHELNGDHPKIIYANNSFCRVTGYARDEIVGLTPRILQGARTDRRVLDRLKDDLDNRRHFQGETFNYKKDGAEYRVEWSVNPIEDNFGEVVAYISFQKDISKEYYYAKQMEIFHKVVDDSTSHIALLDQDMKFFYANSSFLERTRFTKESIIGSKPALLRSGNHDNSFYDKLYSELENSLTFQAVFNNKRADGTLYQELQTIDAIHDGEYLIGYSIIGNSYDEEIKKLGMMVEDSNKDMLTGLFNRKYFDEMIVKFIESYREDTVPFFMFFGDLDNFKAINDTLGHDIGDIVLKLVATLLTQTLRKDDYIFRYGGDEFIWLIPEINHNKALEMKESIKKALGSDEKLKQYNLGISIGMGEYKGEDIKDFFRETDKQMYREKLLNKISSVI